MYTVDRENCKDINRLFLLAFAKEFRKLKITDFIFKTYTFVAVYTAIMVYQQYNNNDYTYGF